MRDKFVYLSKVKVYDKEIFTHERAHEWKSHILDSYVEIYNGFKKKLMPDCPVCFFLDESLLDEVIIDAIIGMRKITDSEFNAVENPNSFKIISYLTYWWLRHKPVSIHYPEEFRVEETRIKKKEHESDEQYEYDCQKAIWQLKHINELVAVEMLVTYIFDFSRVLCGEQECKRIMRAEQGNFCFADFNEMRDVILRKLTYYFAYRTIAPKVIEHLLEAYTFHPAWGLTAPQWAENEEEGIAP